MFIEPISKLYIDDMGRFPVQSRSINHYIMLAYHVDSNTILVEPFQSRHNRHLLAAYDCIISRIKGNGRTVDLHILDNRASESQKLTIEEKWGCKFQLVPPNVHRRNTAERAIRTFKANLLQSSLGFPTLSPTSYWTSYSHKTSSHLTS